MDYDTASMIMSNLHLQKAGHPFDLVKIHLRSTRVDYYLPLPDRIFESRVNVSGVYEQWGSERKSVLGAGGANSGDATQITPSSL